MPPRGALKLPLNTIIKSIGIPTRPNHLSSDHPCERSQRTRKCSHQPFSRDPSLEVITLGQPYRTDELSAQSEQVASSEGALGRLLPSISLCKSTHAELIKPSRASGSEIHPRRYSTAIARATSPHDVVSRTTPSSALIGDVESEEAEGHTRSYRTAEPFSRRVKPLSSSNQWHSASQRPGLAGSPDMWNSDVQSSTSSASPIEHSQYTKNEVIKAPLDQPSLEDAVHALDNKPDYARRARGAVSRSVMKKTRRSELQRSHYPVREADEWSLILRQLEKATPKGEVHYQKRMEVLSLPEGMHATLIDNAGNVFLEIMQRTGTHVQVLPRVIGAAGAGLQSLSLFGTPSQNADALKILPEYVQLHSDGPTAASPNLNNFILKHHKALMPLEEPWRTPDLAALRNPQHGLLRTSDNRSEDLSADDLATLGESLNDITFAKARSVWSQGRTQRTKNNGFINRPSEWTTTNLSEYIDSLTRSTPRQSRLASSTMQSKPNRAHADVEAVAQELTSLFSEPSLAPVVTSLSVGRALSFLVKHNRIIAARRILAVLERSNFRLSASNFAVLLGASAKAGDGFNFRHTLRIMLSQGIRPTAEVWTMLYRLAFTRSPQRANIVVKAMRKKGVLADKAAALDVVKTSIASECTAYLAKGGSLKTFLKLYDTKRAVLYGLKGKSWLTVDALNRMLHAVLLRGRLQDAYELLAEFRERNRASQLSISTLNTFLTAAFRKSDLKLAVAILREFRSGPVADQVVFDEITFRVLFNLAWSQRSFNMLRVLWRYACMHGHAGFDMQDRVFRSMMRFSAEPNALPSAPSRHELWTAWAGKFVLGVADGLHYTVAHQQGKVPDTAFLDHVQQVVAHEENFTESSSAASARELIRLSSASSFPPRSPQARDRRSRLRQFLKADISEIMSLQPVVPIVDVLEKALEKDLEWKQRGLGLPRGLKTPRDQEMMFEEMMKSGIRTPVRVGNAALVRTTRAMR